jgi:hypothetical protein
MLLEEAALKGSVSLENASDPNVDSWMFIG